MFLIFFLALTFSLSQLEIRPTPAASCLRFKLLRLELRVQPKVDDWVDADSRLVEHGGDGQDVEGEVIILALLKWKVYLQAWLGM